MADRDLAAEVDRLNARHAEMAQGIVELATALQSVTRVLATNAPALGLMGARDLGDLDMKLRELISRYQAQG